MPLLGPGDPLPHRPRRVLVAGTTGAGKTTLAAHVATALGIAHTELDALYHGPDWAPRASFVDDVHRFSAGPDWVTEWQYRAVRAHLAARADLLVWLDVSRARVLRQVVTRTLLRRLRRQDLWHGNREPPLRTFFTDPDHVVRWAWTTHHRSAPRVAALRRERPALCVVRLRSRAEVARWLRGPLRDAAALTPAERTGRR
ncbi:AAA family ATPase [Pilimelia terevasa]|uniref:AAA family ATPase n=1 Tax=Pilimelia terevasa TaxID=53372 RepID=UPI001E55CDCA|nr:AAA family ATPase [Pilimelia terevasa]